MPSHWCPEYVAAVESEQLDRVKALIGEPETIAGYQVEALTPYLFDVLIAKRSPYAVGGIVTCTAIIQLLYVLSPGFDLSKTDNLANWTEEHLLAIDYTKAGVDAAAYMDRVFMDAPEGGPSIPYFGLSVSLMQQMAGEPYRWPDSKTYHESFRKIFQFQRAEAKANGAVLINKRSDIITAHALDKLTEGIKDGTITRDDIDRINGTPLGINPSFEAPNYVLAQNAAKQLKEQMEAATRG